MASHQVVCTTQTGTAGHGHIVRVGTGTTSGWSKLWTVAEARAAIARGEVFYTVSPSTKKVALVHPFDCWCGIKTLRSAADAVADNNLDSLPGCA